MKGTLYIVSTPIGNLQDITHRAVNVLREVDAVACEDTRHSLKLLTHLGIKKPLVSYWGEKEKAKSEEVMQRLLSGQGIALISDAGTPGISDPGAVLIREAISAGIEIVPVPGPSALIAALSMSGLPTEEFTFVGFLPSKQGQRKKKIKELSIEPRTVIYYESPHRIIDTLIDMEEAMPGRKAVLIKELTKMHESVIRGDIGSILDRLEHDTIAGEYVILVEGKSKEALSLEEALQEVLVLMKKGMGRKDAVKAVSSEYGLQSRELYQRSLSIQ